MKFKFFIFSLFFLSLTAPPLLAERFTSPTYIIDWGNFNLTSGSKTSSSFRLTDTVGQIAPGLYEGSSLKVKSGFQYIYDTFDYLSFTIDKLEIDLGTLETGLAATSTNLLTVTTPSGRGYELTAQQNHPLWINESNFIPNTRCDDLNCTPSSSRPWTQVDKYGYGFNAAGPAALAYFPDNTYFRPFATLSDNQNPALFASSDLPVKQQATTITYKALISANQGAGEYQNYVTYTLIPKY